VILGTGTPNADPERSGPSVAVVAGNRAYLVDCGPGVVRRAAAAAARHGIAALQADRLGIVFITHLHSDHTLGLPDLMLTAVGVGAENTARGLRAARGEVDDPSSGSKPTRRTSRCVSRASSPTSTTAGRRTRTRSNPASSNRDSNVTVTAIAVPHANWKHAFAYRFESHGEVVVISGDTRPSDAVVKACDGCDVLVHEVYSAERFKARPADWQRYHADAHTSTVELAALRAPRTTQAARALPPALLGRDRRRSGPRGPSGLRRSRVLPPGTWSSTRRAVRDAGPLAGVAMRVS
jgi:ribonuclease BN (tRNA processing enzyme)